MTLFQKQLLNPSGIALDYGVQLQLLLADQQKQRSGNSEWQDTAGGSSKSADVTHEQFFRLSSHLNTALMRQSARLSTNHNHVGVQEPFLCK